jgi:addiction module HigA family antidote
MRPIHPGEILREEFLAPLGLTANALAKALGVPANRITMLVREARSITADTALRLARYFGTTPELWLTLQATFDLRRTERASGSAIRKAVKPIRSATRAA